MGKWRFLTVMSALTCFLLLPLSNAFGVSSHTLKVKSSREGMGRNDRPLNLVPEMTALVANAGAIVEGDGYWGGIGIAMAQPEGAAILGIWAVLCWRPVRFSREQLPAKY